MSADAVPPIDPSERVDVSIVVRPRRPLDELENRLDQPMSRAEFAAQYGADPTDIDRVSAFARQHGLEIVDASQPRRTVRVAGRAGDMAPAFGIQFQNARASDGTVYRAPDRPVQLPPELEEIVQGVFGLDTRRVAEPRD